MIEPYFECEQGVLYHGDCLEVMGQLNDNFDLCLTDPPYGINMSGAHQDNHTKKARTTKYKDFKWDSNIPQKEIFECIIKLTKNQIIFGGNYFIEYLKNSSCWLVWDKRNEGSNFADCELAWTSFNTAVRKFSFRWNGMLQEDMKNKEKRFHPTQKPVELFRQILEKYSEENQIILDPFAGSGTTALACIRSNRKFIIIEREKEYCDIIVNRIKEEIKKPKKVKTSRTLFGS